MNITEQLLAHIAGKAATAKALDIRIGGHWTGVALDSNGTTKAGLSSTLGGGDSDHHHGGQKPVRDAGRLLDYKVQDLAALAKSSSLLEASVGFATINALLDVDVDACVDVNAEEIIAKHGTGKKVAIIGHFPFTPHIRELA
ncbi:MAG: DUF4213 domain-containing protein, partial [Anaerolineae bacterium]|nr:DUF4213 domain-containing protein [Anaerolineae bacterium]